jgi:Tfp pilus assembly protein PilO
VERSALNKLKWILSRWAKKLGILGIVGIALIAFSIASYFLLVVPKNSRIVALAADIQRVKAEPQILVKEDTETVRMQKFYAFFPKQKSSPDLLEKIYASARDESLQLKQGKYNYTVDKTGKLGEYQVILPVKGTYPEIRKFVAKVLNELPSAALDDISFKREAISNAELDARIKFTIYMGTP